MLIRTNAPEQVLQYIELNESFSRSGDDCKGEGGDYVTESQNRSLKSILPPGKPTVKDWQTSSRCHNLLSENRNNVFSRLGLKDPGDESTGIYNNEIEIQML